MPRERDDHSMSMKGTASRGACLLLVCALGLVACGGGGSSSKSTPSSPSAPPGAPNSPSPPQSKREWFAAEDLIADNAAGAIPDATPPLENRHYMPIGSGAAAARHEFRGRIVVSEQTMSGNTPDSNYGQNGLLQFPGFTARFVTVDGHLVPLERGILARTSTRSTWRVILSPGRVWSEEIDGGWSRASFPFVLVCDTNNEAHNGLATFVYDDNGMSSIQFQIVQETASWNRNDFWGRVRASYTPEPVPHENEVRAAFLAERAALTPVRPWSDLDSADSRWDTFVRGLDSDDISAAGIVADGVIYQRGCITRLGDYPYCEYMRHGAYSLTKSMGAALALLRLAQKYGDEVFQLRVRDYVPISAAHAGWDEVRFIDVINMATGIGDANPNPTAVDPFADENAVTLGAWASVASEDEKLAAVFSQGDYAWGPGRVFRYNTTHTFVLAVAMQNFLESREGPDARLWDMVTSEVLNPIGIRYAPMMHTAEGGDTGGVPLMGIGLYPTVDDVAKISTLLQNGGAHGGVQLLSAQGLRHALFKTSAGLPTGEYSDAGAHRYSMSFWSLPYRIAGRCTRQIPYMEGYGGNFVVLLPNGVTAFRFADAENYDVEALVDVAKLLRPWC